MVKLVSKSTLKTFLVSICSAVIFSTSSAQDVDALAEPRDVDDHKVHIGIVTVGWEQFLDINQRKFEDGSRIKLYDISDWQLSVVWEAKIRDNIDPEKFELVELTGVDSSSLLTAYQNNLNSKTDDWSALAPQLKEIAEAADLERLILFAPTENVISATTMFGESRTDYPGGVGIMRYNRSASFCYVSGTLYLFDGVTGVIHTQTRLQEDFGFMKPSAFFFQLTKELRQATFADYSAEQKTFLRQQMESNFDKHFYNSVRRLMQAD